MAWMGGSIAEEEHGSLKNSDDLYLARIDIDFEYPNARQKADFVCLVQELHDGLDRHARKKGVY